MKLTIKLKIYQTSINKIKFLLNIDIITFFIDSIRKNFSFVVLI